MRPASCLPLLLAACLGDKTGDTGPDTGAPPDDSAADTAVEAPVEVCGEVTADTTWSPEAGPITMTCDVVVRGATLTLAEGLRLRAVGRAKLQVGDSDTRGELVVAGTEANPVRILADGGEVTGAWDGVDVREEGVATLRHVEISSGEINLLVHGGEVLVDHVQLLGAGLDGLVLEAGGRLAEGSGHLTIAGSARHPARAGAEVVDSLPAEGSHYLGNGLDLVLVEGGTITAEATWEALGLPYALRGNVDLEGVAAAPATLTVGPGVELLFDDRTALRVSRRGGEAELHVGEPGGARVRVAALQAPRPGAWEGIQLFDGVQAARFYGLDLEHAGGGNYQGALYAEAEVEVLMQDSVVRASAANGVLLLNGAGFHPDSQGLTFTENLALPVVTEADQTHTVPLEDYVGNGRDAVGVRGAVVPRAVTWPDHGIPYVVDGIVRLEGVTAAPAVLTLGAGVTLRFLPDAGLLLSESSGASGLVAPGREDAPIRFTAEGAAVPGAWMGVGVYNGALSTDLLLRHVTIEYAGDESLEAGIYMEAGAFLMEHVTVRHSGENGVTLTGDAAFLTGSTDLVIHDCVRPLTVPAGSAHTVPLDAVLTGNTRDYLFIRDDTQIVRSATWRPLGGVDWWVEDDLIVGERNLDGVVLTLEAGLVLRFATEKGLSVGASSTRGTASLDVRGTASAPVVFTAADALEPGAWEGLELGPNCDQLSPDLQHLDLEYAPLRLAGCEPSLREVSVRDTARDAVTVAAGALLDVRGLTIEDAGGVGLAVQGRAALDGEDVLIARSGEEGLTISNSALALRGLSMIQDSALDGLSSSLSDLVLDGLVIERSGGHGLVFPESTQTDSSTVLNSIFRDNGGDGLHLSSDGSGLSVFDTELSGNGGHGLYRSASSPPALSGMIYRNNALGDIGP